MFVEKQTYFVFLQVKELYIVAFFYLILYLYSKDKLSPCNGIIVIL